MLDVFYTEYFQESCVCICSNYVFAYVRIQDDIPFTFKVTMDARFITKKIMHILF